MSARRWSVPACSWIHCVYSSKYSDLLILWFNFRYQQDLFVSLAFSLSLSLTHTHTLIWTEIGMMICFEGLIDACQSSSAFWALDITPRFHHYLDFLFKCVCVCVCVCVSVFGGRPVCAHACVRRMKTKGAVLSSKKRKPGRCQQSWCHDDDTLFFFSEKTIKKKKEPLWTQTWPRSLEPSPRTRADIRSHHLSPRPSEPPNFFFHSLCYFWLKVCVGTKFIRDWMIKLAELQPPEILK